MIWNRERYVTRLPCTYNMSGSDMDQVVVQNVRLRWSRLANSQWVIRWRRARRLVRATCVIWLDDTCSNPEFGLPGRASPCWLSTCWAEIVNLLRQVGGEVRPDRMSRRDRHRVRLVARLLLIPPYTVSRCLNLARQAVVQDGEESCRTEGMEECLGMNFKKRV